MSSCLQHRELQHVKLPCPGLIKDRFRVSLPAQNHPNEQHLVVHSLNQSICSWSTKSSCSTQWKKTKYLMMKFSMWVIFSFKRLFWHFKLADSINGYWWWILIGKLILPKFCDLSSANSFLSTIYSLNSLVALIFKTSLFWWYLLISALQFIPSKSHFID